MRKREYLSEFPQLRLGLDIHHLRRCSSPDLLEPHILRSLTNVQATAVYSSHSACNFIVIDVDGQAWTFGRYNLGPGKETIISENAPQKWRVHEDLGAPKGTKIVHAACGRNHSLMVGSNGQVWSMGINTLGQVRHSLFRYLCSAETSSDSFSAYACSVDVHLARISRNTNPSMRLGSRTETRRLWSVLESRSLRCSPRAGRVCGLDFRKSYFSS